MRVAPCAWVMDCGFYAKTGMWPAVSKERVRLSTEVTHNHPEGIKVALETADDIFMARFFFEGYHLDYDQPINNNPAECKRRIKTHIERAYGYDLSRTLDEIRPTYGIPEWIRDKTYSYLDDTLKDVLRRWDREIPRR